MASDNTTVFSGFHHTNGSNFSATGRRLGAVDGQTNHHRYLPFADPDGQRAYDAYHRFLPDASRITSELWKLMTVLLVELFHPAAAIPTDLDDTLFHHTAGKVNGAGSWRDAVRSPAPRPCMPGD
jgi:hypothetical protein